jgi:acetyltransferase-like isoleucine patch superfamily enzyme
MEKVIKEKIQRSGFVEFIYIVLLEIIKKIASSITIFFLRLRGYKVDYSVQLGGETLFFQTDKWSIRIDKNTQVGHGVRLKAGFNGKIKIGSNVLIDDYSFISAQESIDIGDDTMIAAGAYIVDFNHKYPLSKYRKDAGKKEGYERKKIKIGVGVWIGAHVMVLPGIKIGDGSVIGAGSVVTKDIPAFSVAVGNPARVIKKIK